MWFASFEANARVEKKWDIEADLTSGQKKTYQIRDSFISRCGLQTRKQSNSLTAPKKIENMTFADINTFMRK